MTNNKIYKELFSTKTYSVHPETEYRYVKALEFIEKVYQDGFTIADISSGRGIFLKLLEKKYNINDLTFTDIENFSSSSISFLELDLNSKSSRDNFTGKYDIITVLDVLEHVEKQYIEILCAHLGLEMEQHLN